ncbi:MAG: HEAT repeat domain-containing protein [Candidatus Eremiobacteraeota bacterium]|nr:HEAT repeat domain-containing protein [Candidatus Eremiobacteraeota bacterium]
MRDETNEHQAFALPGARPRYGPDKLVAVEHIDLHLTPDFAAESLDGICTTTVCALDEAVPRLTLDAVDLEISSVERRTTAAQPGNVRFTCRDGALDIDFDPAIPPGQRETFAIRYRVSKPRHGLFFVKPTAAHPQKIAHLWTQSQDEYARYWFPCLDYPHAKQRTSTTIVVPKGMFALGNGELVERRNDDGRTIFRYRQDVPHSTYLMTMAAGPFVEIAQGTAGRNGVPVFYYVLPGREDDGERAFGKTARMIERFEERIGTPYPYARYSQIAVSDFIFGGMENTSATTQTDRTLHDATAHLDFSSDPLVSHELAHQWFGDLLTCRDWAHAWLNEGFATFMEAVWRESDIGYDEYLYDIFECRTAYFKEENERYARPIVCNTYIDPIEVFDRHLYQKGAAVLHMLRGELGETRFWRALGQYVHDNAQRSVETIDFVRAIENATGRNLRGFFNQWVYHAGHPKLEVRVAWDDRRKVATLIIDQKQTLDAEHPAYEFDVDIAFAPTVAELASIEGGLVRDERRIRAHVERAHETVAVPLDFEPALVRFDPGGFLLADVTYALGTDYAAAALRDDPDVIARIRAARELAKDGGGRAREALEAAFERERFWGVLAETAAAIGATRAPWARGALIRALSHEHPKVVRAAAAALGNFRDENAASALIETAARHPSYFVRAAALTALGKTRDPRAFEVLSSAACQRTWDGTVESGAIHGLSELADARALAPILAAGSAERDVGVRRAAAGALGRAGALVESERSRVVDALERLLDDQTFSVAMDAIAASEQLGDVRLLPALDGLAQRAVDGRLRRHAAEAAIRIRKVSKVPAQVSILRDDLDELREEQRKLQEKIEAIART